MVTFGCAANGVANLHGYRSEFRSPAYSLLITSGVLMFVWASYMFLRDLFSDHRHCRMPAALFLSRFFSQNVIFIYKYPQMLLHLLHCSAPLSGALA